MKFFNLEVDFLLTIIDKKSEDPNFIDNTLINRFVFNNKPNLVLEVLVKKYVYEIFNLIFSKKVFYTGNDIEKLNDNYKIIENSTEVELNLKEYKKYPLYINQETGVKIQPIYPNITKKKNKFYLKIYIDNLFCEKVLLINSGHLSKIINNIFNNYVKVIFSNNKNNFKQLHIGNGIELSFYNNFMEIDVSIIEISRNNTDNVISLLNLNPIKNTFNIYTITNIKSLSQEYNLNNLNISEKITNIMNIGNSGNNNILSNNKFNKFNINEYVFELKFQDDINYFDKINLSDTNFMEMIEVFNNIEFSHKNPKKYLESFIYDNSLLINMSEIYTLNTHVIDLELSKRLGKWYRIQDIIYPYFRIFNKSNTKIHRLNYSELPVKFDICEYCNVPLYDNFYIFYDPITNDIENDLNPGDKKDKDIDDVMNALSENESDNDDESSENSPKSDRVYAKRTKKGLRLTKKSVKKDRPSVSKEKEPASSNTVSNEKVMNIKPTTNSIYKIIQDIDCLYNDEPIEKNIYYEKWGIEFIPICPKCAHSNLYLELNHNILVCSHPRTKIDVINMIQEENIKKILLELYNFIINNKINKKQKNLYYNNESLYLTKYKLINSYELTKPETLFNSHNYNNVKLVPIKMI